MIPRVLIGDDSLTIRKDLEEAFEQEGFEVSLCATLRQAREVLARQQFDLIVLDVVFPDGNGLDLLEEIRSSPAAADIPIIFLSSQAAVTDRIRGLKAGAHDYAAKPYDRLNLVSRAKELVAARRVPEGKEDAHKILIVEDSMTFRAALRDTLASAGYKVLESANGEDGLRLAAQTRPSLILVDGVLPDIDGATVIQRLRLDPALSGTSCFLLTASVSRDQELKVLGAGADAYIRKDQGMSVLLARIASILRTGVDSRLHESQSSVFGPKKVLAVDDSETYLQELAAALRNDGYEVIMARSGREALDLLAVQQVDIILLDVVMPELSGQETCCQIKTSPAWREIPVLMLTAREDRDAMLEGINAGADDYIAKSSDFEVVRARLRAQLRRKHFEAENRHIRDELHKKEVEAAEERAARKVAEARATLMEALEAKTKELEWKNKELEQFAYVASHDLQAPLRAVTSFAQMLASRYNDKLSVEANEFISFITDGAHRMQSLINDLLKYSRVAPGAKAFKSIDFEAVLTEVLKNLQFEIEESHAVITHDTLPTILGDATPLQQLAHNLIGNAIKYRGSEAPRIHISAKESENSWLFCVSDNGIGIAPEHAETVFGIFKRLHSRAKYPGNGIGLAVCRKAVELHGGRIWVDSEPGKGAKFLFTIPKKEKKNATPDPRSVDRDPPG
jgi:DNA-binding response OmpR family regulator